ncbi:MAG: phosphotransferase [Gammaproteobacteria bacterium]
MTTVSLPGTGDWHIDERLAVTPVSRTSRVRQGDRQAVLRQDEAGARQLGLDRVAERAILARVASAGLGPACLDADPARGLLLTEWLPGRAWTAADLRESDNLQQAAALLRRIHTLPPEGPLQDLAAAIHRYEVRAGVTDIADLARDQLTRCRQLESAPALCLCHNDPTPGNFIAGTGRPLRLIDWEYAGLCDPFFDLAVLASGAALTPAGQGILLAAYRQRPPHLADSKRLEAWMTFCGFLGALWEAALAKQNQ